MLTYQEANDRELALKALETKADGEFLEQEYLSESGQLMGRILFKWGKGLYVFPVTLGDLAQDSTGDRKRQLFSLAKSRAGTYLKKLRSAKK